ncbi:hypothetical protein I1A62_03075 (plasmid) [Rhodococcus sp. USK10]|uniref:hypothetical protein n=1 Tax=Rhodococcus sp. USK10 TaxID=2789739 RepID=UPI001C5EB36D|nr:hypothetical protein [Rhodococcus sp. USK10]QYB00095.1 hypothetical protein I1A62_03075 [Rhodococcus sp. USK10]
MAGEGTLVEYLVLVLETLCGRWLRAGETVAASPTLLPSYVPVAQAKSPDADWALPGEVRVRGLRKTKAGMPTATLPEEILTPGEGQVRALISWGGNPAVAFPDQRRTIEALESLELFVQIDPWYSASARLADYVIAPTMPLEAPSTTVFLDALAARGTGYGIGQAYAQGGLNRSMQHLDHGGVRWDGATSRCLGRRWVPGGSGRRTGHCDLRCVHRAGRSPLVRCSGTSGGGSHRE